MKVSKNSAMLALLLNHMFSDGPFFLEESIRLAEAVRYGGKTLPDHTIAVNEYDTTQQQLRR